MKISIVEDEKIDSERIKIFLARFFKENGETTDQLFIEEFGDGKRFLRRTRVAILFFLILKCPGQTDMRYPKNYAIVMKLF